MAAAGFVPGAGQPAGYVQLRPAVGPSRVVQAGAPVNMLTPPRTPVGGPVAQPYVRQPAQAVAMSKHPSNGGHSPLQKVAAAQVRAAPVVAAPVSPMRHMFPANIKENLTQLLSRPAELEARIRMRFKQFAKPNPNHRGEKVMTVEEMDKLACMFAKHLGVDPAIFGELPQMFWRFDFSGDGLLNEDEATRLTMCMLRKYRDSTQPPQPGVVRLGGTIAYRKVEDKYAVSKKLGEGGQGAVYLAKEKTTKKEVVIKYYDKSNPNSPMEDITQEFELMMSLKHPRIAHYFEIFQDFSNVYVVTEPYFGGDLSECINKAVENRVRVNEPWLANIMKQVLAGIAFLHSNDIMHCDIKQENVMITGRDYHNPQVVVIDFGLANAFSARSGPGGTPGYMPPEVWTMGLWLPRGDVFSLGVMLFALRTGRNPFQDGCRSLDDVQYKTLREQPEMGNKGTPQLQTLVYSMIDKEFRQRPTVAQVMDSPWFSNSDDHPVDEGVLQVLARKQTATDVRKALLADLASQQNLAESRELNDLFVQLDLDNDGVVSAEEVRMALQNRWAPDRIDALLGALGSDDSQSVSYEEFMGHLLAIKAPEENELLWRVFNDVGGGKKYLDLKDIQELLQRPAVASILGDRSPEALMRDMDTNRNGRVEFAEFKAVMQGQSPTPKALYRRGDQLQYYSATYASWMNCVVTAVDPKTGAVQVDVKPGYWFQGNELTTKLRSVNKGPANTKAGALGRQIIDGVLNLFNQERR